MRRAPRWTYLGLLAARYPELGYEVRADAVPRDTAVPPLLLQPLLENAVRHGAMGRGSICVDGGVRAHTVYLTVRSPGVFGGGREGGMGLELVRRRVELAWGEHASFTIGPAPDDPRGATLATIEIPREGEPRNERPQGK